MLTSIGVFSSRTDAEHAVHELLDVQVPREAITFLTPEVGSEGHSGVAKTLGAFVGGAVASGAGLSAGIVAATLLVPGIGPILAIGIGAATLFGVGGAAAGKAVGNAIETGLEAEEAEQHPEVATFRRALNEHHSIVAVRTDSPDVNQKACAVLDRLGLHTLAEETQHEPSAISTRDVSDIAVISVNGRIALGQGSHELSELVRQMVNSGRRKFLLDLSGVTYVDSSGLGELVGAMTTVRNAQGTFKLTRLSSKVNDLLKMTHLDKVLDITNDEAEAIRSFA